MADVAASVMTFGEAEGPLPITGGVFAGGVCGASFERGGPYASISASPTDVPDAAPTVNRTHVMLFAGNCSTRPDPFCGSAPTAIVDPSLNDSVPEEMFSDGPGRSWMTSLVIVCCAVHVSCAHAPASSLFDTHSPRPPRTIEGMTGYPTTTPSLIRLGLVNVVTDDEAVAVAFSARFAHRSHFQKISSRFTNACSHSGSLDVAYCATACDFRLVARV